ncbi:MAG: hypothetical protein R2729_16135 [Bryobacteraceae bacterium]
MSVPMTGILARRWFALLAVAWCLPAATLDEALASLSRRIRTQLARGDAFSLDVRAGSRAVDADRVAAYLRRSFGKPSAAGADATPIVVTLSANQMSQLLVVEVGSGEPLVLIHPYDAPPEPDSERVTIRLRELGSSKTPVLAAVDTPNGLAMLLADRVVLGDASLSFNPSAPRPRDLRGAFSIEDGYYRATLPGLQCRVTTEPFAVRCAEADTPLVRGRNFYRYPFGDVYCTAEWGDSATLATHLDGTLRRHPGGQVLARDFPSEIVPMDGEQRPRLIAGEPGGASIRSYRIEPGSAVADERETPLDGRLVALGNGLAIVERHGLHTVLRVEVTGDP